MSVRPPLLATLALTACATSSVSATNPSPRPLSPRPLMSVAIFSAARPTRPFVEVAVLKARQRNGPFTESSDVVATLRHDAARMGCDAVIINGSADTASQGRGSGPGVITSGFWGVCIVYTDGAAPAPVVTEPTPPPPPLTHERDLAMLRIFDRLDKDHDAILGVTEMPGDTALTLLAHDGNKDGWLTRAELVSSLHARREDRDLRRNVH